MPYSPSSSATPTGGSDVNAALKEAARLKLHEDPYWELLNFYQRGIPTLGRLRSIASRELFYSADGAKDPQAEMVAIIRDWDKDPPTDVTTVPSTKVDDESAVDAAKEKLDASVHCRLPRKTRWLQSKLARFLYPKSQKCPGLKSFQEKTKAESVALVFSSFYLNNPSSSFGHTFLRLIPRKITASSTVAPIVTDQQSELLDFGVNYAANTPPGINALFYMFGGLAGFFPGTYSGMPYYFKVREYNDSESRDLWSYHLNLDSTEVSHLIERIWEVGSVRYPYYYFTSNCSAIILHALEVAAPRFVLMDRLKVYVIPSDTVRLVAQTPGLIKAIDFRPSSKAVAVNRYALLSNRERADFRDYETKLPEYEKSPHSQPVNVVDAWIDDFDASHTAAELETKADVKKARFRLLSLRAKIKSSSQSLNYPTEVKQRPDLAHPSGRLGLGFGHEKNVGSYSELALRFALHDELDPALGYPPYSKIEMMGFKARIPVDGNKIEFEDLTFARVRSFSPLNRRYSGLSWQADLGGRRFRDRNCSRCFGGEAVGGVGAAYEVFEGGLVYGLANFGSDVAPQFQGSAARIHLGPTAGVLYSKINSPLSLGVEGGLRALVFSTENRDRYGKIELRYHVLGNWTLGGSSQWRNGSRDSIVTVYHYF